jgi:hypothetical protein
MKPSPFEPILRLAASTSALVAVFHKARGFSEAWQWFFLTLAAVLLIPVLIAKKRRRAARLAAEPTLLEKPPSKRRLWVFILILGVVSLTGPLWMRYMDATLPTSTLILTSITSFGFAVFVSILSWRYWNKNV